MSTYHHIRNWPLIYRLAIIIVYSKPHRFLHTFKWRCETLMCHVSFFLESKIKRKKTILHFLIPLDGGLTVLNRQLS